MSKKLSICIPTFNRAVFLGELLSDILENQNSNEIEIVISDNASTDNTSEVVEHFKDKFAYFTYSRFNENKGPDANFLKCVSLATAKYCWLMGSDDSIRSDGIKIVLEKLKNYEPAVSLINITECDYNLKKIGTHFWFDDGKTYFNTKDKNELVDLFNMANPLWGLFFGYISSVVIKKADWDSVRYNTKFNGTLFSFTSIIMELIVKGCGVASVSEPIVLNRGYNDSMVAELKGNHFNRLVLDVDMYIIFSDIMPCLKTKSAYLNVAKRNYGFYYLLKIILNAKHKDWKIVKEKFRIIGINPWLLNSVEFLNYFKFVFKLIYIFRVNYLPKRRIIKISKK